MDVENRNESRAEEVEQEGVSNLFGESSLVENEDEEGGSMAVEN